MIEGLVMPHSVTLLDDRLLVLSSAEGLLLEGTRNPVAKIPTFARGLDLFHDLYVVGASRNRNPDDRPKSDLMVRDVSNGFFVVDPRTLDSRLVQIGFTIPEIHSVLALDEEIAPEGRMRFPDGA